MFTKFGSHAFFCILNNMFEGFQTSSPLFILGDQLFNPNISQLFLFLVLPVAISWPIPSGFCRPRKWMHGLPQQIGPLRLGGLNLRNFSVTRLQYRRRSRRQWLLYYKEIVPFFLGTNLDISTFIQTNVIPMLWVWTKGSVPEENDWQTQRATKTFVQSSHRLNRVMLGFYNTWECWRAVTFILFTVRSLPLHLGNKLNQEWPSLLPVEGVSCL